MKTALKRLFTTGLGTLKSNPACRQAGACASTRYRRPGNVSRLLACASISETIAKAQLRHTAALDATRVHMERSMASHAQSYRPKAAAELLGISTATLWRWAKERPDFPRPRKLSARCTVFDRDELLSWRDAASHTARSYIVTTDCTTK